MLKLMSIFTMIVSGKLLTRSKAYWVLYNEQKNLIDDENKFITSFYYRKIGIEIQKRIEMESI